MVKEAAQRDIVRITEHGEGAYIFCSEAVFESKVERAVKDALYEKELAAVISRGEGDFGAGRIFHGTEAAKAEVARRLSL